MNPHVSGDREPLADRQSAPPARRRRPLHRPLTAHVLATAVELNAKAACRAVLVAALNASARAWWERLGFHRFDLEDPAELDLYLLTSEIAATLARIG